MHISEFALFGSKQAAEDFLRAINKRRTSSGQGNWTSIKTHPSCSSFLVPIHRRSLSNCLDIIERCKVITRNEARRQGFYFGPFDGDFGREREKLEDIHLLFDAVKSFYGSSNFPALRAIILAYLSACYALKESIGKRYDKTHLKHKLGSWWLERDKEMKAPAGLLRQFEVYMNTEKHGGSLVGLSSNIELRPQAQVTEIEIGPLPDGVDPKSVKISAEGVLGTIHKGTPMERRIPVGLSRASYIVAVEHPPTMHLGKKIEGMSLIEMLELIRDYYAQLLFDARQLCGDTGN